MCFNYVKKEKISLSRFVLLPTPISSSLSDADIIAYFMPTVI